MSLILYILVLSCRSPLECREISHARGQTEQHAQLPSPLGNNYACTGGDNLEICNIMSWGAICLGALSNDPILHVLVSLRHDHATVRMLPCLNPCSIVI